MNGWRRQVGQLFITGLSGEELTPDEKSLFSEYPIGNFILFDRNLREPDQITALCRSLWNLRRDPPPLIAIDQEGGRVHRLPEPFTRFPVAADVGKKGDPELAYRLGTAAGRELRAAGINLNFAPVLDVLSNPANPVIGDRALGSDPATVRILGCKISLGLQDSSVISCGKHFPGHGDTDKDSHLELPVVNKARGDLEACELSPFVHACRNGVGGLMTAHVLYPALDPNLPASLSRSIVGNLLRSGLAYDGVVFSDDLEMQAIAHSHPPEEASALALDSGADISMFCHHSEKAARALESLWQKAERAESSRSRVEESCGRIGRLKRRYLKSFTGTQGEEFKKTADLESHRKLVADIQGSL